MSLQGSSTRTSCERGRAAVGSRGGERAERLLDLVDFWLTFAAGLLMLDRELLSRLGKGTAVGCARSDGSRDRVRTGRKTNECIATPRGEHTAV